jgi:hypothetical protein
MYIYYLFLIGFVVEYAVAGKHCKPGNNCQRGKYMLDLIHDSYTVSLY